MATIAALSLAEQSAKLTAAALSAARAEAELDQAELERWRTDAAERHESAVARGEKAAQTKAENKAYAGLKAEYNTLYYEAIRLQGALAALGQVCDAAAVADTFSAEALKLLQDNKAETQKRYDAVMARGGEIHYKLPERMRI
ncbi:hypothetical protein EBZ80_22185 [bacterium]|nr:hypothetical protein [bacterium]